MKHLKIEQSTSSIEVVDPKVIDKLYNLVLFHPVGESLDSTSNLKGNLQCSHAYEDVVDYLTTNYKDLSISVSGGLYIRFNDKNVETICATNWGDGIGITKIQASVVNTFNDKFSNIVEGMAISVLFIPVAIFLLPIFKPSLLWQSYIYILLMVVVWVVRGICF